MTTVDTPIPDTLRGAALYLKRRGWHQGGFLATAPTRDCPFPPACAGGAIRIAITGTAQGLYAQDLENGLTGPQQAAIYNALEAVAFWIDPNLFLNDEDTNCLELIATWNDRPFITADKVVTVLEAVAFLYEESDTSTH